MTSLRSSSRSNFLFEHDLFGKPLHTFPDHALAEAIKGLDRGQRRRPHISRRHARAIETTAKSERPDSRRPVRGKIFFRHATDSADDRLAGKDGQLRGNARGTENKRWKELQRQ